MSTVRRHIEVEAPASAALASWSYFARWVRTSHRRLACDELACVDAVRAGMVAFEPADGGGRTTVTFKVDCDEESGPSCAVLEQNVARDLVVFKDYMERGGHEVGRPTRAQAQVMLEHEERHKHKPVQGHVGVEDETANFRNHFPT